MIYFAKVNYSFYWFFPIFPTYWQSLARPSIEIWFIHTRHFGFERNLYEILYKNIRERRKNTTKFNIHSNFALILFISNSIRSASSQRKQSTHTNKKIRFEPSKIRPRLILTGTRLNELFSKIHHLIRAFRDGENHSCVATLK